MAYYAKLGLDNIVLAVVAVDNIDCMDRQGVESEEIGIEHLIKHHGHQIWKKCSYNSHGGIRYDPVTLQPTNEPGFRANYPGPGWYYSSEHDIFYPQVPRDINGEICFSYTLNTTTGLWDPPIPKPEITQELIESKKIWVWDESVHTDNNTAGWILINIEGEIAE